VVLDIDGSTVEGTAKYSGVTLYADGGKRNPIWGTIDSNGHVNATVKAAFGSYAKTGTLPQLSLKTSSRGWGKVETFEFTLKKTP
jgi:hypothetical protein